MVAPRGEKKKRREGKLGEDGGGWAGGYKAQQSVRVIGSNTQIE